MMKIAIQTRNLNADGMILWPDPTSLLQRARRNWSCRYQKALQMPICGIMNI